MWWWLLLIRVLLGLVFLATGAMKAGTPAVSGQAAEVLGVPRVLARPVGYALAPAEIVCGLGLLTTAAAPWAAASTVALLVAFTAIVAANLIRGRRPSCGCFGTASRRPIGWSAVARNLALTAVAAVLLAQAVGSDDPCRLGCYTTAWRRPVPLLGAGLAVESVFLAVLAGLVVKLVLQAGRVQIRLDALETGTHHRPPASYVELNGHGHGSSPAIPADIAAWLEQASSGVLIFVAEGCSACNQLLSALDTYDDGPILIVSTSTTYPTVRRHPVAIDPLAEFWQSMRVQFSPTAVLMDCHHGELRRAQGLPDVLTMLGETVGAAGPPPRPGAEVVEIND